MMRTPQQRLRRPVAFHSRATREDRPHATPPLGRPLGSVNDALFKNMYSMLLLVTRSRPFCHVSCSPRKSTRSFSAHIVMKSNLAKSNAPPNPLELNVPNLVIVVCNGRRLSVVGVRRGCTRRGNVVRLGQASPCGGAMRGSMRWISGRGAG